MIWLLLVLVLVAFSAADSSCRDDSCTEQQKFINKHISINNYFSGEPDPTYFDVIESSISSAELKANQILVKTLYVSLDPYQRGRMRASNPDKVPIGAPITAGTVAEVVASGDDAKYKPGDIVYVYVGWTTFAIVDDSAVVVQLDATQDLSLALGTLGMPGYSAYHGLFEIGKPKAGETVVVSAAAGAVGSVVVQLAKSVGCYVVGIVGTFEKADYVREQLKADAVINYNEIGQDHDSILQALREAAPNGIDVYFDNTGGAQLEAAISHANRFGRIVACGMISQYNKESFEHQYGIRNLIQVVSKRLLIQGFIIGDHRDGFTKAIAHMSSMISSGQLKPKQDVVEGLDNAPKAFIGLFSGKNLGKLVIKV